MLLKVPCIYILWCDDLWLVYMCVYSRLYTDKSQGINNGNTATPATTANIQYIHNGSAAAAAAWLVGRSSAWHRHTVAALLYTYDTRTKAISHGTRRRNITLHFTFTTHSHHIAHIYTLSLSIYTIFFIQSTYGVEWKFRISSQSLVDNRIERIARLYTLSSVHLYTCTRLCTICI